MNNANPPRPLDDLIEELLTLSPGADEYWDVLAEAANHHPGSLLFTAGSELCASSNPTHRWVGADLLCGINWIQYEGAEATARMRILRPLINDSDEDVVWAAVNSIGNLQHREVVPVIAQAASHPDPDVRMQVVYAVGDRTGEPLAVKLLLDAVADSDTDVRNWATFYLAGSELRTPKIQQALESRLSDDAPEVRMEALGGLVTRGFLEHVDQILTEYKALVETDDEDTNREVHLRVLLDAAAATGDRRFRPLLRELLEERDIELWRVRDAVLKCFLWGEPERDIVSPKPAV